MRFGLLGPIEVWQDGRPLGVGSGRERFVLASLLLNAGRVTPAGTLIDEMWTEPPVSGRAQLHNMISNIRRRLRAADERLIQSRPTGYELCLDGHELDLLEFRRLAERGRQAATDGDHARALSVLTEAMSCWRGPALADVPDELAAGVRQALHEERLSAGQTLLEAQLALGRHDAVLRDIDPLIADHPYREGLHQMRMLALVGAGRRAEALEHYRLTYRRFADELGVEPGRSLRELEHRILQGESPAVIQAPAEPAVPRQLPPASVALAGRDKLLGEITETLRDAASPVVLLVGPGGVGKTALALAAAHGSAGDFPDGQLYADLRGDSERRADTHAVLARFLRALGVDESTLPEDPDERVARYRSELAGRRVLIVLDDATTERQVRPLLPGANQCRTLITSRSQLGALVGAARWTVPGLAAPDALELLGTIIGRDRVAGEPVAAAGIVQLCAQLPLAVSIAAARLAVHPHWTLEEFRERLAEQRGRLDELSVGDLDVRASIALSYAALEPRTRQLFRRLGLINVPTWPAWIVDRLTGEPAGRLLEALADVHLVEPVGRDSVDQSRFRLHDLVAEFAEERARAEDDAADGTAALARVLSGWLALATEADERIPHDLVRASTMDIPDPPEDPARIARQRPSDWFEAERRTLALAVDQAGRLGLADVAGALALRLSGFLSLRSCGEEWETLLRQVVVVVREQGSRHVLGRLLGSLFLASFRRDRHAELDGIAADQLDQARLLADRELEARALTHAALAAVRLGRFAEAIAAAEHAVAVARHRDVDKSVLRTAMSALAFANMTSGHPERALPLLEQTLAIDRAEGTVLQTALHLYHYGMALAEAGRAGEAERPLTEALRISIEFGHIGRTAYLEQVLADVAIRTGRLSVAAARLDRSRATHERIGGGDGLAEALRSTGDLAAAEGRWPDAISWLHRALDIWRDIESRIEVARTLARLERAHTATGEPDCAAACGREYRAILAAMSLDEGCLYLPPVY